MELLYTGIQTPNYDQQVKKEVFLIQILGFKKFK